MSKTLLGQPIKKQRWNIMLVKSLLLAFCLVQLISLDNSFCFALNTAPSGKQSNEGAPIILKLAHGSRQNHPTNIIAQEIAEDIYNQTNGKIRLEVYDNMQFGEELDLINLVMQEKLDFAVVSTGPLSNFEKNQSVFDFPYLFSSREQAFQVLDGDPGQAVLKKLNDCGLEGICYWENGFRSLTTKNKLIQHPADLAQLRLRVMQNSIYISFFTELGALPTPLAWGEVIPSLKSGIIEAQENPIPIIYHNHLEEYQHYLILTEHSFNPHVVITNHSLKTKLSPAQIRLIFSKFQSARLRQRSLVHEQTKTLTSILQEKGMKIIKPNLGEFRQRGRTFSRQALRNLDPVIQKLFGRYLQ